MKPTITQVSLSALIATLFFAVPVSADTVRPAVGLALCDAENLAFAHDYQAAMVKIEKADAVPNKTAEEEGLISALRT